MPRHTPDRSSLQARADGGSGKLPGIIVYRGASPFDGAPVVVVATLTSDNPKTGDMVQTWIIREDVNPVLARQTGQDRSVCGDCRLASGNGCYVTANPINAVFDGLRRGIYRDDTRNLARAAETIRGREVRMGAYGDPVLVPVGVWRVLLSGATKWTGYTHAWRNPIAWPLREYVMASADNVRDFEDAHAMGWRTFRVRTKGIASSWIDPLERGEIVCPASPEGGNVTTCRACGLCNGAGERKAPVSIAIIVHGSSAVLSNHARMLARGV